VKWLRKRLFSAVALANDLTSLFIHVSFLPTIPITPMLYFPIVTLIFEVIACVLVYLLTSSKLFPIAFTLITVFEIIFETLIFFGWL